MQDCIAAVAVAQAATPYVRPNALIFIVEGGKLALHVSHGRENALMLMAQKRAATRGERYLFSAEIVEESILPESSDLPDVSIASPAVHLLMDAVFEIMPHLERFQESVYDQTPRLEAFVLPYAPEVESGFGAVRTDQGPLLEIFHSREQAIDFLRRHDALMDAEQREEAYDDFGYKPIADRSLRPPTVIGGFAAALIGARYRLRRLIRQEMLKPR